MSMPFCSAYFTHKGLVRSDNEDSILIGGSVIAGISMDCPSHVDTLSLPAILCVADGIGGAAHGEVASRMVLNVFLQYFPVPEECDDVRFMIIEAKNVLDQVVLDHPSYVGFGTTIAGLIITNDSAIIFNCGDSRVYRICDGDIHRLSHDHSVVQELCDNGEITVEEMYTHPFRNIITSSVSGDPRRQISKMTLKKTPLSGRERFLLCTDGVYEVIRDCELALICRSPDIKQAADEIMGICLSRGGPDNISFILVSS
jgi:protein phosphatase